METEINSEDDVDATLHVMYEYGSDDVTECMTTFKENLPNHMARLEDHVKAYGNNAEIDDMEDSMICCTLMVADCPVDVEIEIIPSLSWDVENGKNQIFSFRGYKNSRSALDHQSQLSKRNPST